MFGGEAKFRRKTKMDEEKIIRWAVYRRNTRNYGQCRPSNNKKAIKFGMRILNGTYPLIFKYEHRDLTHSQRLRYSNNFCLNVTEWIASPGGTKFSKPIEETSKEKLNVFLKGFCICEKERWHTVSLQKFINEIHLRAAADRFLSLAAALQTVFH